MLGLQVSLSYFFEIKIIIHLCGYYIALLGVHAIFGAFLFGLIVPRGSHLFKECNERIEEFVLNVTLPLYFALSGLKTDVTTIHTGDEGAITILVCFAATIGKFIGAGGTAYFSGMSIRESSVIAVLMNTRGLIELIVLNLGIQSGILSIRTFSVMVVMCLFTTFLTNPLVELIYPRAMRAREVEDEEAVDDHSNVNSKKKKHHHNVDGEDIETEGADTFSRLAVVVESLPHLQQIIDLLQYFMPNEIDSQLAVTAVHFIEPTNSTKDEFLPLNEDGKLIRIDEETTDFAHALNDFEDPAAKKPEILPLSMFCRANRIPVNAFRIQGDPDEFPIVLKNLSRANDCSFSIVPWRPTSAYVQKLFWSSMNAANTPVALFFSTEVLHAHEHDSESAKESRGKSDGSDNHVREPSVRQRGNSVYMRDPVPMFDPDETGEAGVQLYSTLPATILPQHRRGTVTNQLNKLRTVGKTASRIIALVTGRYLDTTMFPILMRFSENKLNNIVIMVPSDSETFEYEVLDAFNSFKTQTAAMSNISYNIMEACLNDYQKMYEECKLYEFDLIISSYIEPPVEPVANRPPLAMIASNRSARTSSISGVLADAIFSPSLVEATPNRIPSKFLGTNVKYPELGIIGNMIFEDTSLKSTKVLVLHESEKLSNSHKIATTTQLTPIEDVEVEVAKEGYEVQQEEERGEQNV